MSGGHEVADLLASGIPTDWTGHQRRSLALVHHCVQRISGYSICSSHRSHHCSSTCLQSGSHGWASTHHRGTGGDDATDLFRGSACILPNIWNAVSKRHISDLIPPLKEMNINHVPRESPIRHKTFWSDCSCP